MYGKSKSGEENPKQRNQMEKKKFKKEGGLKNILLLKFCGSKQNKMS